MVIILNTQYRFRALLLLPKLISGRGGGGTCNGRCDGVVILATAASLDLSFRLEIPYYFQYVLCLCVSLWGGGEGGGVQCYFLKPSMSLAYNDKAKQTVHS